MLSKLFIAGLSPKLLARSKTFDKHLAVLSTLADSGTETLASLRGYRPGRPPKYGTLVLTSDCLLFCQKSKVGESILSIQLSQLSAFEITRLMKHSVVKIYTPGLEFSFATRMAILDVRKFSEGLQSFLKKNK